MRSLVALGLLAALGTGLVATDAQATRHSWRWERCRFQGLEPGHWTKREVHLTIHCAVDKWPTAHSTADYVADRESNFFYRATNPTSGACGVYQHLPRYWPGRVTSFNDALPRWNLGTSCYNARSNVLVAIRMARMGGWGPWSM